MEQSMAAVGEEAAPASSAQAPRLAYPATLSTPSTFLLVARFAAIYDAPMHVLYESICQSSQNYIQQPSFNISNSQYPCNTSHLI